MKASELLVRCLENEGVRYMTRLAVCYQISTTLSVQAPSATLSAGSSQGYIAAMHHEMGQYMTATRQGEG